jgi:succinoglycan biosynthesis transport protein ExoP
MRLGSTQRTSKWLTSQLDDLKRQIESDQGEITELQKKLGVIGFDEKNSDYLQTEALNSLTKASNDAMIARILSEAKLRYLKDSDPNLVEGEVNLMTQGGPSSQQNSLLQNLRNQQAQVASAYASLLSQFGPNYPEVKQTKAQLSEITLEVSAEEERILNQANLSYRAASANEAMAKDALKQETSKTFSAHNDLVRYVLLLHDYQSHRTLYEALVEKLREAGITSGLEAAEVDVVDLADLPAIPNPPGPVLQLLGGIGIGLIFGSLCAFLLERLDSRISSADQAERVADIPLLATIPRMIRKTLNAAPGERRTDSITNPGTRYAEALQVLRSSILLARPGAPPKRILITSAVPTEGKSTTAINLAATFARHRARTILIDADLRRGVQDKRLGLEGSAGVTNVLTGSVTLEDAIQQVPDHESLFFLQAGPHPPDAAVLTASAEMASLIEMCSQRFDFVIIDTPPILGISDTIHLGQLAEVAILVVREQFSTRNAVRSAIARLKNSNIPLLGFALNNVDLSAHAYSYAYKSYYNGYYTDSKEDGQ